MCKFQWFPTLLVEIRREGGESPTNVSKMLLRAVHNNFSNLQYINKFVTKPVHFILIYLLIICISLLKCFLLFCAFLSPPLSWLFNLSLLWLHQTISEPQDHENGEERWGSGMARAEGEQTESSMLVLVSVTFTALQFYHLLIHGSAEVMALVAHQTHFHTALKRKGLLWWPQVCTLKVLILLQVVSILQLV